MDDNHRSNLSLEDMDRQSMLHGYTSIDQHEKDGPFILDRGQGITITDQNGKQYVDAVAGLWCVNLGWGRREVIDAITAQLEKLSYYHNFTSISNEPAIRLADQILRLAPPNMSKVFFGNSGSDANDTNVKLVWYYNNLRGKPEKKKIISRELAYHGVTIGAGSLTGLPMVHKHFDLPIANVLHVEKPDYYWHAAPRQSEADYAQDLAAKLDARIQAEGPETVAAFIAEPIMGAGGVVVPPAGYFAEIQQVLKKHDVLMLVDEVICGFGRLGKWFGCDVFGIEPDMMTIAKGLTNGYFPMSASLIGDKVWDVLRNSSAEIGAFGHGFTYSAHPVGAAAGLAVLEVMAREKIVEHVADVGAYFQSQLREKFLSHPLIGDVRGIGLMAAVEPVADKSAPRAFDPGLKLGPKLAKLCLEEGMIVRALFQSTAIGFSPPLIVTKAQIDDIIGRFAAAFARFEKEIIAEGHWTG
jgi:L-2,4-diaminobutyrate transaminase